MSRSALGLVLSQQTPVDPDGEQSAYFRSSRALQTSEDLNSHQSCVAGVLPEKEDEDDEVYDNVVQARAAFSAATQACEENDYDTMDAREQVEDDDSITLPD